MLGNFYFELSPSFCTASAAVPFMWIAPFDLSEIANILANQLTRVSLLLSGRKEMENFLENKILSQI